MHVLAAFDKFKDSMSAVEACRTAADAARETLGDDTEVTEAPLTDGGEGFCPILTTAAGGELSHHKVSGPRGEEVTAPIGRVLSSDLPPEALKFLPGVEGWIGIIEMASAAGLEQVPLAERHPSHCTTKGVGELIGIAADHEVSAILIGVGGSATSDLGLGALEALGLSPDGAEAITPSKWSSVSGFSGGLPEDLPPIYIACDVDNPLLGPRGAAAVFGPQKGLKPDEVEPHDKESRRLAGLLCTHFDRPADLMERPGSGAAGGIAFGLQTALDAQLVPGFELVSAWLDLQGKIAQADCILSGEGKIDESSLGGKGPVALAEASSRAGKGALLFAGALEPRAESAIPKQFPGASVTCITPPNTPLETALAEGRTNLKRAVREALGDRQT